MSEWIVSPQIIREWIKDSGAVYKQIYEEFGYVKTTISLDDFDSHIWNTTTYCICEKCHLTVIGKLPQQIFNGKFVKETSICFYTDKSINCDRLLIEMKMQQACE